MCCFYQQIAWRTFHRACLQPEAHALISHGHEAEIEKEREGEEARERVEGAAGKKEGCSSEQRSSVEQRLQLDVII